MIVFKIFKDICKLNKKKYINNINLNISMIILKIFK